MKFVWCLYFYLVIVFFLISLKPLPLTRPRRPGETKLWESVPACIKYCEPLYSWDRDICSYALNRVSGFYLKVIFQTQNHRSSPQSWAACPETSVELCFRQGSFSVLSTVLCAGFCGLTLTFQPVPLPLEFLYGECCVTEAVPSVLPPWMTGSFSRLSFIEGRPRSSGLWPDWFSYNSRSPPVRAFASWWAALVSSAPHWWLFAQ